MKKILLSATSFAVVAVAAVSIAPTTSEAIPAFTRQTGAACYSCHFQTFPAINSFGRAFKMGAFTDVGEQALIEDDNLSLPSVLNMSFGLRAVYTNTRTTNTSKPNTSSTKWDIPGEGNLMAAGRVGSNTGAFLDIGASGVTNWQLMNSLDFDTFKAGLNVANVAFGPTGAIEISNVFGQQSGKLNGGAVSSINKVLGETRATSIAAWAGNETFLVQATAVAIADARKVTSPSFVPLIRGTYIADVGNAELLLGAGYMNGTQTAVGVNDGVDVKFLDAQLQGEMNDMTYGVYADYVSSSSKNGSNKFTGGNNDQRGYSIRAEVEPIANILIGAGYGQLKTSGITTANNDTIKTSQVAVTYKFYQNMNINTYYQVAKSNASKDKTLAVDFTALF